MAFPAITYTDNESAASALVSNAAAAGLDLSGLNPIAQLQSLGANLLISDPTTVNVPAGDVVSGTFGANKSGGADTGTYTFPGAVVITTTASFTGGTFTTTLKSVTALATPGALAATQFTGFASTVSGAVLMGFGTTHDVALKNQAGTTVLGVTQNSLNVTLAGGASFVTSVSSTTALATPTALSATQFTAFASTVSGAALMGFGTTNDVALMNRAGTVVLGVGPNTTAVNMTGVVSIAGASLTLSTAGAAFALQGTTAAGADQASGAVTIKGNVGTGAGAVGGIVFQVPVTHGSDSVAQTLTTVLTLSATTTVAATFAGALTATGLFTASAGVTMTGTLTMATAASLLTPGATSFNITNNAGTANNVTVLDAGGVTLGNPAAGSTQQVVIAGTGYGAGVASLRLNGLTTAAVTNQVGTLTNAPVAGNPTFWAPVSIAGVIKYVPFW